MAFAYAGFDAAGPIGDFTSGDLLGHGATAQENCIGCEVADWPSQCESWKWFVVQSKENMIGCMNAVTQLLQLVAEGNPLASDQLLPVVYHELRRLAAAKLSQEKPGQTLNATALVHEAYLRLVGADDEHGSWNSRGHFFAAAAEAMRRILIENARQKASVKHGGKVRRVPFDEAFSVADEPPNRLLALDEALTELEQNDEQAARLVKLRYFAGMSHQEAAEALGVSRRVGDRLWALARAWLYQRLNNT